MASNQQQQRDDSKMFDAYVSLRRVAQEYHLENQLSIPRIVFVGETSSGKSMLVQNFLRFPCAFSKSDVGTRCPVLYRLRYNPNLTDGTILIKHPPNVGRPERLAEHLTEVMANIERDQQFSSNEYLVHIESNQYRDFEILDVPGLIGGCPDAQREEAVERITENYVRDPKFLIVQLKEASQLPENSFGMKRIRELCLAELSLRGSTFPARPDYEQSTITIQTKFDTFMTKCRYTSVANNDMEKLLQHFNDKTLFTSMIFNGYEFSHNNDKQNTEYIANLPRLEETYVNNWIRSLDQKAPSGHGSENFNEDRYRPLIGINVVRNRIQDMWVDAFRSALPGILQNLQRLIQDNKDEYKKLVSIVEEKDLNSVRQNYQKYIREFRHTLSEYVGFRAEVHNLFDKDEYGRTYPEVEDEYNRWSRKTDLVWSGHQTADEMSGASIPHFKEKLLGAAHFERLRRVFYHMILTYIPQNKGNGWIESAASVLHGITADHENTEKASREWLYSYISETFAIGICWLTQMYTFFLEHFETHVHEALLNTSGRFLSLSSGHEKFFNLLRLEYHLTTRKMIRRAVESIRHSRYAKMKYVAHNICHYLRVLLTSIPETIRTNENTKINIVDPNPSKFIDNTDKFLPEIRNQQTSNYVQPTRNVVHEIFITVRGLLLHDITASFYANVVADMHEYKSIDIDESLASRIEGMKNEEIARLSEIDFDRQIRDLQNVFDKLKSLEDSADEIRRATRAFDRRQQDESEEYRDESKLLFQQRRAREHQKILNKLYQVKLKEAESESVIENILLEQPKTEEEELFMKLKDDATSGRIDLAIMFEKHDKADLELGLIGYEHLRMSEKKGNSTKTNSAKPKNNEPRITHSDVAAALPTRPPPPPATATTAAAAATETRLDTADDNKPIPAATDTAVPKSNDGKSTSKWYGGGPVAKK